MEKYHKEPPCLLPRPNHPHFPSLHCTRNYCVWVPCHPQPWSPREKQWTLTRSLISKGSQAGASRCAQHRALRFSPKRQDGWWERFSHNFYVSVCFMCGWRRIGDRRTLGSSGTAGTRTGLGSPPISTRAVCAWWYSTGFCCVWLTERPYYMDFLASCHLWWCLLLFELLLLFPPKLQSADQSECGRMGSQTGAALQKQTLLWFIVGESLTHRGCIDACDEDS